MAPQARGFWTRGRLWQDCAKRGQAGTCTTPDKGLSPQLQHPPLPVSPLVRTRLFLGALRKHIIANSFLIFCQGNESIKLTTKWGGTWRRPNDEERGTGPHHSPSEAHLGGLLLPHSTDGLFHSESARHQPGSLSCLLVSTSTAKASTSSKRSRPGLGRKPPGWHPSGRGPSGGKGCLPSREALGFASPGRSSPAPRITQNRVRHSPPARSAVGSVCGHRGGLQDFKTTFFRRTRNDTRRRWAHASQRAIAGHFRPSLWQLCAPPRARMWWRFCRGLVRAREGNPAAMGAHLKAAFVLFCGGHVLHI